MKALSRVRLLATPWTAAYQAPPSMGFSRQEYWSGVPLPSGAISRASKSNGLNGGHGHGHKAQSFRQVVHLSGKKGQVCADCAQRRYIFHCFPVSIRLCSVSAPVNRGLALLYCSNDLFRFGVTMYLLAIGLQQGRLL